MAGMRGEAGDRRARAWRAAELALRTLVPLEAWRESLLHASVPGGPGGAADPALRAGLGIAAVVGWTAAETLFYGMLWALKGRRLPFARAALGLLQVSMIDPLANAIAARAGAHPAAWAVALVGTRLVPGSGHGGFAVAFGSLGLLTVGRMALAARVQAQATGRSWREAAGLVAPAWAVSHVALAWALDLALGRSGAR